MKQIFIYFLIVFFAGLIIYQVFYATSMMEGFDGTTDPKTSTPDASSSSSNCAAADANKLAYQNSADIKTLQKQMSDLSGAKDQVTKNTSDISTLQTQVNALAQAQTKPVSKVTEPTPTITGT